MTTYLVSPSEVKLLEKLKGDGITSTLPEEKGADVLVYTRQGLLGVQRKEIPNDFLQSVTDGRLAREMALLPKSCKFCLLLLEGEFKYWPDGRVAIGRREPSRFTKTQINGILFDVRYIRGVDCDYTEDLDDTIFYVKTVTQWLNKEKHLGLFSRPGGPKGSWIVPTIQETHSWLLQGFDGIGPALASSIIEHFGRIPLAWTCSLEELMRVPRLSTKRARIIWETLRQTSEPSASVKVPTETSMSKLDRLRQKLTNV